MDELTMLARNNRNDGDDNVNIDLVQRRSKVESEEKYQTKISKKHFSIRYLRQWWRMWRKKRTCNTEIIITEYDDDDLNQSDNNQDTNNEVSEVKDMRIERTKTYSRIGALVIKQKRWVRKRRINFKQASSKRRRCWWSSWYWY